MKYYDMFVSRGNHGVTGTRDSGEIAGHKPGTPAQGTQPCRIFGYRPRTDLFDASRRFNLMSRLGFTMLDPIWDGTSTRTNWDEAACWKRTDNRTKLVCYITQSNRAGVGTISIKPLAQGRPVCSAITSEIARLLLAGRTNLDLYETIEGDYHV